MMSPIGVVTHQRGGVGNPFACSQLANAGTKGSLENRDHTLSSHGGKVATMKERRPQATGWRLNISVCYTLSDRCRKTNQSSRAFPVSL